jgi:hypothetical protein
MCHPAIAAFLGSGVAQQPSLQNPLDLLPLWRQPTQWLVGLGGTKNQQQHF